jgi:hypothetical protein
VASPRSLAKAFNRFRIEGSRSEVAFGARACALVPSPLPFSLTTPFTAFCERQGVKNCRSLFPAEAGGATSAGRLTPIIPVVVAQDNRVWKTSTQFHDLFQLPPQKWEEVRRFLPDFSFRLLQLVELPFEEIAGTADGRLALRALKAQAVGELLGDPVWEPSLLRVVSAGVLDYLIRYVWNQDVDKEGFSLRLKELPRTDLNPETMTLAQKIREEGREEGMRRAIQSLLEVRFQVVPAGLLEELGLVREMERLEALHRHAIRCATLEEFAAGL